MTKGEKISWLIYVCYTICILYHDVFYAGGEHTYYIYLFSAEKAYVYIIVCHHQKEGECWNLDFDDNKLLSIYTYTSSHL